MTDQHAAFLERIRQDYPDDLPRLIYADWLEEQGNPRAEFIRVQCAMARLHRLDPAFQPLAERSQALLRAHGPNWFSGLQRSFRGPMPHYLTRRGFAEELQLDLNWLSERMDRTGFSVVRSLPDVLGVRVRELASQGPLLPELAEDVFHAFPSLNFSLNFLGDAWFAALFACDAPPLLRELNLNSTLAGLRTAQALAESPWLNGLTALNLGANVLGDEGLDRLVRSPHPVQLSHLNLSNCGITDEGLELLVDSTLLPQLAVLDLSGNRIEGDGVATLAETPAAANLRHLLLGGNDLGEESLLVLTESEHLSRLEVLDLSGVHPPGPLTTNPFEEFGRLLADASRLPSLRVLDLRVEWMLPARHRWDRRAPRLSASTRRDLEERFGDGFYLNGS